MYAIVGLVASELCVFAFIVNDVLPTGAQNLVLCVAAKYLALNSSKGNFFINM